MMHAPTDNDDNNDDDEVERNFCVDGDGKNKTRLLHPELKSLLHYRAKVDQIGHFDHLDQLVKVN